MTRSHKTTITIASILMLILCYAGTSYAIGEFSMGINLGVTSAPNNIDKYTNSYNMYMKEYSESSPDTSVKQINNPYIPVYGMNLRYQFNYFLLRLGWHLAYSLVPIKGSITPAGGEKNSIRFNTYQNSFPITIGLIMPLKERTYFYIGAGRTLHYALIKITNSNPIPASIMQNYKDRYYKMFVGYNLIIGAEIPIANRFTISAEWIHQEGRSYPAKNGGTDAGGNDVSTPEITINAKGDILLFGINYYIHM